MARFNNPASRPAAAPKAPSPIKTEVRNSPIPKVTQPARAGAPTNSSSSPRQINHETIAQRAYFLWKTNGGSEFDNWIRAERELRAGK